MPASVGPQHRHYALYMLFPYIHTDGQHCRPRKSKGEDGIGLNFHVAQYLALFLSLTLFLLLYTYTVSPHLFCLFI